MIYYTALVLVTVGALCNRSALPYALVLCTVWAVFCVLGRFDLYGVYPWVDAISIYPLAILAWLKPRWWNVTLVCICFATVTTHLVFWTAYYSDVYLGEEYKTALRSLFLLSMAVALVGDIDVKRLVGLAVERVLGLWRGAPSVGFARGLSGQTFQKEEVGDHPRSGAVRRIQHRKHRMGDREVNISCRGGGNQAPLCNRRSDVGSNSRVHISTKEA